MPLALDHLVLAARTLAEGLDWCEATLGIRPEAGGRHVFMGTHNRVFTIASAAFPRAYFEIIAIDPALSAPGRARWFDLDDVALQRVLARGPQLVHWVARCTDIVAACAAMRAGGVDCGGVERAERATPRGPLRWQISLRADGHRPLAGAAPALIAWDDAHPTDTLPDSGVALVAMSVAGWPEALAPLLPAGIARAAAAASGAAPPISVRMASPRGVVTLQSTRLEG
ncbi:MAG: VOC family protein [Burkholderiales bacterium]|nr:VOC family protein [Burkholderiales bacterium]MDE2627976.1 VOC family protein [Burkholderiales bacterium]